MFMVIYQVSYGNNLIRILTTAKKRYCRTPFVEQLFAEPLLVEHLSIAASIKLKII